MKRFIHAVVASAAILPAIASTADACPFCHGKNGVNEVNAGIFNDKFLPTLLAVLAPFPLFLGVVAAIHFGFPVRKNLEIVEAQNERGTNEQPR